MGVCFFGAKNKIYIVYQTVSCKNYKKMVYFFEKERVGVSPMTTKGDYL